MGLLGTKELDPWGPHGDPMGTHGAHGNPWEPHGNPWDPWGPMGTHGNPWEPMGTHGTPWDPMGPMGTHGNPWKPDFLMENRGTREQHRQPEHMGSQQNKAHFNFSFSGPFSHRRLQATRFANVLLITAWLVATWFSQSLQTLPIPCSQCACLSCASNHSS